MPAQVTALIRLQRTFAPLAVLAVLSLATDPENADEPDLPQLRGSIRRKRP